jgi:hypothetical protein
MKQVGVDPDMNLFADLDPRSKPKQFRRGGSGSDSVDGSGMKTRASSSWLRIRIRIDPHYFWQLDPVPQWSEQLHPVPH